MALPDRDMPVPVTDDPATWLAIGGKARRIEREDEIREVALALAADHGDPRPDLIQHVTCNRTQANSVVGSANMSDDRDAWLIAIKGDFKSPGTASRRFDVEDRSERRYSVITIVVDARTGAPTDMGTSNCYPQLAVAGDVVTDYSAAAGPGTRRT